MSVIIVALKINIICEETLVTIVHSRKMKLKAKRVHGIAEAVVFVTIFLTCFVLILLESIKHENITKEGSCIDSNKGI